MGLERLVSVIQGKKNNFETDLFAPILSAIEKEIKSEKLTVSLIQRRIVADHIRAIVFAVADGVTPSNEGRGYVIKKLIIDITDIIAQAGGKNPIIHKIVPAVVEAMREPYPELAVQSKDIAGRIRKSKRP